jgi:hypothetical protein
MNKKYAPKHGDSCSTNMLKLQSILLQMHIH